MSLATGTKLGPYVIVAPLGAGGMGEVYRATDTRLKRDVALKVLPDAMAGHPDSLARFQREAEMLAALNHPHIAHIYGVEGRALVMELVEGPTLADRIAGAMSFHDALPIAAQIASALEAAHEQGIIHRDLKPANIKVRPDGTVKVLDFGLAKAMGPISTSVAEFAEATTAERPVGMTGLGVILGTPAYMAPEQARGAVADKRADIWAFGVVLFEMLTGRRLFTGETASDTLASVLRQEIDVRAVPETTPADVVRLLSRCLERDPKQRLRDIGEARVLLGHPDVLSNSGLAGARAAGKPVVRDARLAWTVAALALTGIAVLAVPAIQYFRAGNVDVPEQRSQVVTPAAEDPNSFAISPDGLQLVFSASVGVKTQLWIQELRSETPQPLAGTEAGASPFWSPDSRAVGFFADGNVKWIDVAGGPAHTVAPANQGRGGSWNQYGDIIFAPHVSQPLYRVSSSPGAAPKPISQLHPPSQTGHSSPWFLPDGRHYLYQVDGTEGGVYVGALDSMEGRRLTGAGSAAVYAPSGFLIFSRQGSLVAQHFDLETLTLTGETFVVAQSPAYRGGRVGSDVVTGALVYRSGSGAAFQLAWVDRGGKQIGSVGDPHTSASVGLDLSPDDARVVLDRPVAGGNRDVLVLETTRAGVIRLTNDAAFELSPVWSPDGERVAFNSNRSGAFQIFERPASGGGADGLMLPSSQDVLAAEDWSREFLLYRRVDPLTRRDLWALPVSASGHGQPFPIVNTRFDEREGQFSPNQKWVAYASDQFGRSDIYAQPFPGTGGAIPVSIAGGTQPRWRSDGTELFYIALNNVLTKVPTVFGADEKSLRVGKPVPLFASRIANPGVARTHLYAVARDGQRFLIEQIADEGIATLTIVRNWRPGR